MWKVESIMTLRFEIGFQPTRFLSVSSSESKKNCFTHCFSTKEQFKQRYHRRYRRHGIKISMISTSSITPADWKSFLASDEAKMANVELSTFIDDIKNAANAKDHWSLLETDPYADIFVKSADLENPYIIHFHSLAKGNR